MFWVFLYWLLRQSTRTWCVLLALCLGLGAAIFLADRPQQRPEIVYDDSGVADAVRELNECRPNTIVLTPSQGRYLQSGELDEMVELSFPGSKVEVKNGVATVWIASLRFDEAALNFTARVYAATYTRLATVEMNCADGTVVDLLA